MIGKRIYSFWLGRLDNKKNLLFLRRKETENQSDAIEAYPLGPDKTFLIEQDEIQGFEVCMKDHAGKKRHILFFSEEAEAKKALGRIEDRLRQLQPLSRAWIWAVFVGIWSLGFLFAAGLNYEAASPASYQKTQASLSEKRGALQKKQLRQAASPVAVKKKSPPMSIDVSMLPQKQAWSFGNPDGEPLFVFADPNCQYCQKLELILRDFEKTHHIMIYPTPVLGVKSLENIIHIACTDNPPEYWRLWMTSKLMDESSQIKKKCGQQALLAANANLALFGSLGFSSVPVIVRVDGEVHYGALSVDELKFWLRVSTDGKEEVKEKK